VLEKNVMTKDGIRIFEQFVRESFSEGRAHRELRLTLEEVDYLRKKYSNIIIKKISLKDKNEVICEQLDYKIWYDVKFN
jgi:hypothetical protein